VKRIVGDQLLHALSAANVRSDDDPFEIAFRVQEEQLDRIAEITVVGLAVADAMQPYRRDRRDHEVKC
jgi:hypothetical protein